MFIENQETGFYSLFATHPPISKRIEALVKFAGGRDEPAPIVEAAPAGPRSTKGPWG